MEGSNQGPHVLCRGRACAGECQAGLQLEWPAAAAHWIAFEALHAQQLYLGTCQIAKVQQLTVSISRLGSDSRHKQAGRTILLELSSRGLSCTPSRQPCHVRCRAGWGSSCVLGTQCHAVEPCCCVAGGSYLCHCMAQPEVGCWLLL